MFEFNPNLHLGTPDKSREDILELFMQENRFLELYFLICAGIGFSFFNITSKLNNGAESAKYSPSGLIRKGELDSLKENLIEMIEKTEDLFSFDLNLIYEFLSMRTKPEWENNESKN